MRFRTTILQSGKTTTGFQVPDEIVEALGRGQRAHRAPIGQPLSERIDLLAAPPLRPGRRRKLFDAVGIAQTGRRKAKRVRPEGHISEQLQ